MDDHDHIRKITDTFEFTHLSPITVFYRTILTWTVTLDKLLNITGFTHQSPSTLFLRTKPAWKITQDQLLILLGLFTSHQHEPFN